MSELISPTIATLPTSFTVDLNGNGLGVGAIGLHIGLPKTGSSAIQAFLQENALALAGLGVDYSLHPDALSHVAGVPNGNARALLRYLDPRRRQHRFDVEAFEQAEFFKVYMPSRDRFTLISSELLSAVDWWQLQRFRDRIACGHSVIVVALMRNIYDHALSTWNQSVKWHAYDKSFEHFARNEYNNPQISAFRKYGKCFGWRKIKVINYDDTRLNIIAPLLRAIGVTTPPIWRAARVNRSLTRTELAVQMALNAIHHDRRLSKALARGLVWVRPDAAAARLERPDVSRFLSDRFRPEVERLIEVSGVDMAWVLDSARQAPPSLAAAE